MSGTLKIVKDCDSFFKELTTKFDFRCLEALDISNNPIGSDLLDEFFSSLNFRSLKIITARNLPLTRSIKGPYTDLSDFSKIKATYGGR